MIRKYFRFLLRVVLLKEINLKGWLALFVFFILLAIVLSPVLFFLSKKPVLLGEMYCYYKYKDGIQNGVGVRQKKNFPELLKYYGVIGESRFKIPYNSPFIMDTITIYSNERVKIFKYSRDSTYALILSENYWHKPNVRLSQSTRYSYVPIFILHSEPYIR